MQSKQFKFLKLESNDKRSSWAQGRLELTIPRIRDRSLCLLRYKTLTRERLKKYSGLFYFICTSLTYRDYKGTSINDVPCFLVIFSLPTYLVLLYNVLFWEQSWTPLPTPNIGCHWWTFPSMISMYLTYYQESRPST